ncbi:hypothetical protein LTR64_002472 [Lithohypha guttulata]|uniref:Uncharacterized protein n=1 Tax=Lithohypha guttulata TaxID=1690604 RepID=A0AAN7SXS7_9EURO|nr:hypothetical protein LTR51_001302 [Lithohypha guttulata]KAK5083540.1 hypothetical protein LTR05_006043 [Lithohypha guttulata]
MAEPTAFAKATKAIRSTIGLPIALANWIAREPLITGPLLWALTRGPPELRERLLQPFRSNLLARDANVRLGKFITALKICVALGTVKRINRALDALALNAWYLPGMKPMAKWRWDGRTEVVVITGGCSGFGYEMVKRFAGKAKIVIIDIMALPAELEKLLINNAGIGGDFNMVRHSHTKTDNGLIGDGRTILDTSTEFASRIMAVNLTSHFVLIREFLPGMLDAKKGHVVGIASMASFVSAPGMVDYCVTKVGVLALHEGLRNELLSRYENGYCIATTSVHPSWHATGIIKGLEDNLANHGIVVDPPSNVAEAVFDQVLAHRSGQIFMPRSAEGESGMRRMPIWVQDVLLGNVQLNPFSRKKSISE